MKEWEEKEGKRSGDTHNGRLQNTIFIDIP